MYFKFLFSLLALAALWLTDSSPKLTERDYGRTCLALAMFSEARSEGAAAMYEVGMVALRRARDPLHRWPQDVCGVIEETEQFQGVGHWAFPRQPEKIDNESWESALWIAGKVANGMDTGPCSGAFFFNQSPPKGQVGNNSSASSFKCRLGALYFYGDIR